MIFVNFSNGESGLSWPYGTPASGMLGLNVSGYTSLTLQGHLAQRGFNLPFQLNQIGGNLYLIVTTVPTYQSISPNYLNFTLGAHH